MNFGYETKGANTLVTGKFFASRFVIPNAGILNSVSVYLKNASGVPQNIQIGIYNDTSGLIGTKLISSDTLSLPVGFDDWRTVSLASNLLLGAAYWLTVQLENSASIVYLYYDAGGTDQGAFKEACTFGDWSDNPAGLTYSTNKISISASYTYVNPNANTWFQQPKSQIDPEMIEEAIARLILAHNEDEEAHLGTGQSLQSHKASEIIDHIAESIIADKIKPGEIWELHRHSISSLERLLASRPELALKINKKVWTGAAGERFAMYLTFDGFYIYASLQTTPAKVMKIDPVTMLTVATWTGASGENTARGLIFDGTYIYVGLGITPAKVIKIDPVTMATVATWTGASGQNNARPLTFDGTYIYVGLGISPAKVVKINLSTMATVATWTGASGQNLASSLAFDGIYCYVGLSIAPAKVVKINLSTMATVATWTGGTYQDTCSALVFDGTYIYAALETSPGDISGQVVKINPVTMATDNVWTGEADEYDAFGLCFDGTYIYVGCQTEPTIIIKINPATMLTISRWTGASGEDLCSSIAFDGEALFFLLGTNPAKIISKIMRNIDEIGT